MFLDIRQHAAPWSRGATHFATALALAALTYGTSAQSVDPEVDEEARRHGIFIDSLDVNLINIEVHVTRDGQPVTDLTVDDFELLDDGQPVEITHFVRVEEGARLTGNEPTAPVADAAPVEDTALREPSSVIVLVDHPFISPISRQLVFDRLRDHLDRLVEEGTRVMVVSKTRQVEVALQPTSGRAEIEAALDRMASLSTGNYATEVRRVVQRIQQSNNTTESRQAGPGAGGAQTETAESDARSAYRDAQSHSQEQLAEARLSIALMRDFLGSLAGMPGRKAVLYVADRLPLRSGELVWRTWFEKFGFDWGNRLGVPSVAAVLSDYDSSQEIRSLIADANANRIAFYPVGAGSDAGPNLIGAESRGLTAANRSFSRVNESDDGLRWLARGTGGRTALGRGDLGGFLDDLRQDLTHYYSLGYASPHRGDGEMHKIEVRIRGQEDVPKGERLALRYLEEYRDKSAEQQMADRTLASLMLGASENPLDVRLEVGESVKTTDGLYSVPIEIRMPVANLVLVPGKTSHRAAVSIQLIVRDDEGRLSPPARIELPIEIPNAGLLQALSENAEYRTVVTLREGPQTIGVGVQDDLGATHSNVQVQVDVGEPG